MRDRNVGGVRRATGALRAIRTHFIPVVVLCSVFGGVIGGSIVVGAVSGGASTTPTQTDRLHAAETADDRVRGDDSRMVSETIDQMAVEAVTIRTAPGSRFDDVDPGGSVSDLTTEKETIAAGDVLVVEVASAELSNALASDSEETDPNARLLELVRSGELEIRIADSDSSATLDLSATNETGGLRVIPETDGSGASILIDTEQAVFEDETTGVTPGGLDVVIGDRADEPVSKHVTVTPRNASFETDENGRINLTVDANRTITGSTTVAPGTNLTVNIRSKEPTAFNITRTARVREDGTFSLRVDFGNVTKGTRFEVTIPDEGFASAATDGILTATSTASVRLTPQRVGTDGPQTVVVESINLSEGGFVTVYDQSFLTSDRSEAPESYRGSSEYLRAGSHTNVTVTLDNAYEGEGTLVVVPHLDTNDNEAFDSHNASVDEPYRGADGGAIIAIANVSTGAEDGDNSSADDQHMGPPDARTESGETSANSLEGGHADGSDDGPSDSGNETDATSTGERGPTEAQLSEADGPGFGSLAGLTAIVITALLVVVARSRRP